MEAHLKSQLKDTRVGKFLSHRRFAIPTAPTQEDQRKPLVSTLLPLKQSHFSGVFRSLRQCACLFLCCLWLDSIQAASPAPSVGDNIASKPTPPTAAPANISTPKPSSTPNSAPASIETTRNNWINTPEALAGIAVLGLSWVGLVRRRQQQPSSESPEGTQDSSLNTERKATEAALRASEELNRTLLASLPQHIFFKDRNSVFRRVNEPFARDFGLSPEQIVGKSDHDFFPAELAEKYRADDQRVMANRQPVYLEERNIIQGKERYVEVVKTPVMDDRGELIGLLGLFTDITLRKQTEMEMETLHKRLLDASRQAGMAEVATGVLHNVGNVLNSINVSATLLSERLRNSEIANLARVSHLLSTHQSDLAQYLTQDPKGKLIPQFLVALSDQLTEENQSLVKELTSLQQSVDHVKDIVATQQSYAKMSGIVETLPLGPLVEDALRMNAGALVRHKIQVVREFEEVPAISVEKHKLLQILINLIRNAKYALDENPQPEKTLTLRIRRLNEQMVCIEVADNGIGIAQDDLTRIFGHGFTTRKDGHGFGLHSGAIAAKEMGGCLRVASAGRGHGATFTLELPVTRETPQPHE